MRGLYDLSVSMVLVSGAVAGFGLCVLVLAPLGVGLFTVGLIARSGHRRRVWRMPV